MIDDISSFDPGARLRADVIVIGSGIAGAEVACHLARHQKDVLLLESGREQFDLCLVLHMEYKQNNKNALTVLYTSVVNIRWNKKISCSK